MVLFELYCFQGSFALDCWEISFYDNECFFVLQIQFKMLLNLMEYSGLHTYALPQKSFSLALMFKTRVMFTVTYNGSLQRKSFQGA